MFDVLAYLFEQYNDPEACADRPQLTRHLEAAGFEDDEIADALLWLDGLCTQSDAQRQDIDAGSGMRIYTEEEQERLVPGVRGMLQFLQDNAALSPGQRELVIDRLLALPDDEISIATTKLVALLVLWVQKTELPVLLGEELLDAVHGEPTMQ